MPSAAAIRAGAAYVELYAKSNRLVQGLKGGEKLLKNFGRKIAAIGGLVTGAGMAIAGPFVAAAKAFASAGDELDKMSMRIGASVEFLSALGYAAQIGGTNISAMEVGFRRMQRTAYDAKRGLSTAKEAFDDLGVTIEDSSGQLKGTEQLFMESAAALSKIENNTKKAALATIIFGRAGTSLLPMLNNGAAGLTRTMEEAKELGLIMSKEDTDSAAALTDAMYRMGAVLKMIWVRIGGAVAPMLTELANRTAKLASRVIDWVKANKPLLVSIFKLGVIVAAAGAAITAVGVAIIGLGAVLGGIATIISTLGAVVGVLGSALAAILSPAGLVTAAVVGLGAALLHFSGVGRRALDWLGGIFAKLKDDALATFGAIQDAMAAGDMQAAARVLWAALKMEWTRGVAWLTEKWVAFKGEFHRVWSEATSGLAMIFTDAVAGLESIWVQFTGWFVDRWKWAEKGIAKGFGYMIAKLQGLDVGEVLADVNRQYDLQAGKRQSSRADRLAEIESNRQSRQEALAEDLVADLAKHDTAYAAQIADARRRVSEAETAWEKARKGAEDARAKVEAAKQSGADEGGSDAAQAAAGRIAGTFSAAAAVRLGMGGNAQERAAKAAEEIARSNKEVERNTRRLLMQWGD